MPTVLDQLRSMTVVVADTGEFDAVKRLKPVDCTTNPTLILKAANSPGGAELVEEALAWGRSQGGPREAVVTAVARRLSVSFGVELSRLVPGRVSTEVDADLSFDAEATVAAAREIIKAYEARGVDRGKVLVKIASTWEGIEAARVLQAEGIDCNLTLLFSLPQALAAAEARAYLISPFVGRILDWHVKAGAGPFDAESDPGVKSVRTIHAAFKSRGHATIVMGASFRNVGQIKALAGCDRLTISPALLDELAKEEGELPRRLHDAPRAVDGEARTAATPLDEPSFRWALNEDAMASEKLSEGIRLFAKDLRDLQALLRARLDRAA